MRRKANGWLSGRMIGFLQLLGRHQSDAVAKVGSQAQFVWVCFICGCLNTLRRAMVELRRALQENAIVREPLLNANYEKQEVSVSGLVRCCQSWTCQVGLITIVVAEKDLGDSILPGIDFRKNWCALENSWWTSIGYTCKTRSFHPSSQYCSSCGRCWPSPTIKRRFLRKKY
jgi:hypothetical protein